MKFGQGVYCGDGGWRAQIMGGGKRVAGSGGLGEWVSGEKLTAGGGEVAGRACPAPTGVMVVGAVCFQHSSHVNVENTCIFYLIIIV